MTSSRIRKAKKVGTIELIKRIIAFFQKGNFSTLDSWIMPNLVRKTHTGVRLTVFLVAGYADCGPNEKRDN